VTACHVCGTREGQGHWFIHWEDAQFLERLNTYTDHAAKVGREYGIRLAVKRRLGR
jgi:hypothetical protein